MPSQADTPTDARRDLALLELIRAVGETGYRFVTVTPETHRRVLERRAAARACDLRDVFGWNLPFDEILLPQPIRNALRDGGMMVREEGACKSLVRISSIGDRLFLHSAYPTEDADAVFLGPDSYRFAAFLSAEIPALGPVRRLVDVGTGAGVGAIAAAPLLMDAQLTLTDVNPLALRLARINAAYAGLDVETVECEGLAGVPDPLDLVIANPPFIVDPLRRTYRDGGDLHGARLSLDWATEAAGRLAPGGAVLLYTGSAIVAGRDGFKEALGRAMAARGCATRYYEIDPDIFGEQLDQPGYEEVERIAAVGAVIRRPPTNRTAAA
ncbi:MAG: methyltransferase [Alphaproteobacteria bacterium]|nr:methyltransferase [Alphaproteobacteria bacterium]